MIYSVLKEKLVGMFDPQKLRAAPQEWGFWGEAEKEIKVVGYATNITPQVIEQAREAGANLLLTHHDSWEFVFGLKECCNKLLEQWGITHGFFHAPLDDADFGTSASLAKAIGMRGGKKVMPYAEVFLAGLVGEVAPEEFGAFTTRLSGVLGEPVRAFRNNQEQIHKVCVAAGGGNMTTEMQVAVEAGCDTYITGEYVLYSQQYARLNGMNLLVGSHTNTEILGVERMVEMLAEGTDVRAVRLEEPGE